MSGTGFRVLQARGFVPVAKGVRVGLDGVDLGRGEAVLIELADAENVMHVCAAGGLRKVQLKGIARGLFDYNKGPAKWGAKGPRGRADSVSASCFRKLISTQSPT